VAPPPESKVEAAAFEAGVAWGEGTKANGAGVGEVVGTSRRVPGVVAGAAMFIGAGVEGVAVDAVGVDVADGVATVAGVGVGTKPGNGSSGVGAAIGPTVGKGLATDGAGIGVGAAAN